MFRRRRRAPRSHHAFYSELILSHPSLFFPPERGETRGRYLSHLYVHCFPSFPPPLFCNFYFCERVVYSARISLTWEVPFKLYDAVMFCTSFRLLLFVVNKFCFQLCILFIYFTFRPFTHPVFPAPSPSPPTPVHFINSFTPNHIDFAYNVTL